jgi:hypothetical protein
MQMGAVIEGNIVHLQADSSKVTNATNPTKFISRNYPPVVPAKIPVTEDVQQH